MPKKVHYESGRTHIMPVSGEHLIMSCGRWMQANHAPNDKWHTDDGTKVTCKRCLMAMIDTTDENMFEILMERL